MPALATLEVFVIVVVNVPNVPLTVANGSMMPSRNDSTIYIYVAVASGNYFLSAKPMDDGQCSHAIRFDLAAQSTSGYNHPYLRQEINYTTKAKIFCSIGFEG